MSHRALCGPDRDRRPRERVQGHGHRVGVLHRRSRTRRDRTRIPRAGRRGQSRGIAQGRRSERRTHECTPFSALPECPSIIGARPTTEGGWSRSPNEGAAGGWVMQEPMRNGRPDDRPASAQPEESGWSFTAVGLNGGIRTVRVDQLRGAVRLLTPADSAPGARFGRRWLATTAARVHLEPGHANV